MVGWLGGLVVNLQVGGGLWTGSAFDFEKTIQQRASACHETLPLRFELPDSLFEGATVAAQEYQVHVLQETHHASNEGLLKSEYKCPRLCNDES